MANYKGIEYLRNKLNQKRVRVLLRYKYYEYKDDKVTPSPTIPRELKGVYRSSLGWCAKAVDNIADRISFREFDNDLFGFNEIFNMNNPDVLFDSAILGALIASCSFVYITPDADGFPRLQVIDGSNATGIMDDITGLLSEGYAVLERDSETDAPLIEAYFVAGRTDYYYYEKGAKVKVESRPNVVAYPLLVPIIYRPDAKRPFGHSRISRACMNIQDKAAFTMTRTDISADFYSIPQKYVLGLSQEAEPMEGFKASIATMLQFTKDEDGDKPTVGQFTQQSVEPHLAQLRMLASTFAGETGLTLDDLGYVSDNPSSVEAIKAAHESLRLTARKAQKTFGSGFLNVGYLATCLRDGKPYLRREFYNVKPLFEPLFEPDVAALSGIGDGAIKLNQAVPDFIDADKLRNLTGI